MLRILGSAKTLCDSITRREMLRVGGIGTFSLGLTDLWSLQALQAAQQPATSTTGHAATFGRAKRIILLYLYGAAAQHETFDPKPERRPRFAASSSRSTPSCRGFRSASICPSSRGSPIGWPSFVR